VTTVVEAALVIVNVVCRSDDEVWLLSPAYVAVALAVPAFILAVYSTAVVVARFPTPVTLAVQGVWAMPL
jgi:hypothetical protein